MKVDNLTVEVKANLTVSKCTAEACLKLLELYLRDNPDMEVISDIQNGFDFRLVERGGRDD